MRLILACALLVSGCLYEETQGPDPETLRVDQTDVMLQVGHTVNLGLSFTSGDEPGWGQWSTPDPGLVSLSYFDDGVVTVRGTSVGEARVIASYRSTARTVTVTVVSP